MDDAGSFSEMKQESKEDLLEIVDNLKQEEQTRDSLNQHIQSEYNHNNFVIVSNDAESNNIRFKQECKEEDPLNIADSFDLKQEVQTTETFNDNQNKSNKSVPKKVRYNCNKCHKSFSLKGNLKKHIQSAHEKVRYNCDKCDKSFSWKNDLNAHIKGKHEDVQYDCEKCDKKFSNQANFITHIKSVHPIVVTSVTLLNSQRNKSTKERIHKRSV